MFSNEIRKKKQDDMRCEGIILFDLNIEHVFDVITQKMNEEVKKGASY